MGRVGSVVERKTTFKRDRGEVLCNSGSIQIYDLQQKNKQNAVIFHMTQDRYRLLYYRFLFIRTYHQ